MEEKSRGRINQTKHPSRSRNKDSAAGDDADLIMTKIMEMIDKLAKGDPAGCLAIDSVDPLTCSLVEKLNQLAESTQAMVADSHEMAIGLCEHYDALNRIASGDFAYRAPIDSPHELIAKLGELINLSAASLIQTIEELQLKDQALNVANDKLSNIIEFLPDATFVIDRNKRLIAWNRAIEAMTGVDKAAMLGSSDYALPFYGTRPTVLVDLLDMDYEELSHLYIYVERKGATLFAENYIADFRNGKSIHLWITASPLFDSSGARVGAIESIRDISNLKQAEQKNAQLQEQLRQSQKMEAIGQLAGGIAHDFNNILTAIIGYGELIMRKACENDDCQRFAERIVAASKRASKLTLDMLAFGRRQVLNPQSCDLNAVVITMEEMLQRLIGEDIVMELLLAPEQLTVMADVGQIQQVLMNLVTNARDAMPAGGELTIRTRLYREDNADDHQQSRRETGAQFALLSVSDTGIGMDADTMQKIFDPFFTTKPVGKGTGLGLAMVFGLIAQHEGTITVESSPGQGSTFFVKLPSVEYTGSPVEEADPRSPNLKSHQGGKILLVEDNDISRQVFIEILQDAGYSVITAANGEDAVAIYRKNYDRIDLVILDVIMPRMNGREALEIIKGEGHPVRYLFMSGYTADIIHSKGKLEKELNFIAKPVVIDDFLSKIRSILEAAP